jgi:CheY-like chemotaxis protein
MLDTEQFAQHLRDALDHLYDPGALRRNPLASLLGVAGKPDTPLALRQKLTDTIESLRPRPDPSTHSGAWHTYAILYYRYVERCPQQEVADQLGFSVRHLRREQGVALEVLATRLWVAHQKQGSPETWPTAGTSTSPSVPRVDRMVEDEVAWLRDVSCNQAAQLPQVLSRVLELTQALAAQHRVSIDVAIPAGLPSLAIPPAALEQALLSLFMVAMRSAPGGHLQVSAIATSWGVQIEVLAAGDSAPTDLASSDERPRLEVARCLMNMFGGDLAVPIAGDILPARLTVPALERVPILAIDDNEDTLQLLGRYTLATRYRFRGARNLDDALALAATTVPRIILLDVMMPGVDGWELLGRLRHEPLTKDVPIIMVTVLDQEELALSLGAAALLRKPVSREAFLKALDRLLSSKASAPR